MARWGDDPYVVDNREAACALYRDDLLDGQLPYTVWDVRRELAGRDLACQCPLDSTCHADTLLWAANCPEHELVAAMPVIAPAGLARQPMKPEDIDVAAEVDAAMTGPDAIALRDELIALVQAYDLLRAHEENAPGPMTTDEVVRWRVQEDRLERDVAHAGRTVASTITAGRPCVCGHPWGRPAHPYRAGGPMPCTVPGCGCNDFRTMRPPPEPRPTPSDSTTPTPED
jgi:hypothetical protein